MLGAMAVWWKLDLATNGRQLLHWLVQSKLHWSNLRFSTVYPADQWRPADGWGDLPVWDSGVNDQQGDQLSTSTPRSADPCHPRHKTTQQGRWSSKRDKKQNFSVMRQGRQNHRWEKVDCQKLSEKLPNYICRVPFWKCNSLPTSNT